MNDDTKEVVGWLILGGVVLIIFTFAVLYDSGKTSAVHSSCEEASVKANTVFLFDFSDPITDIVTKSIKSNFYKHQNSIEVGGKLTLLRITPTLYESDYEICKPQNPSDLIRNKHWNCENPIVKGIDKARERAAKQFCKFSNEMDKIVHKINEQAKGTLPSSPLIESISEISRREDFTGEKARKIVLFSDLLQHTDKYSFYSTPSARPVVNDIVKNNNIDISNVKIEVQYIPRQQFESQQRLARKFWEDFFQQSKAILQITPITSTKQ